MKTHDLELVPNSLGGVRSYLNGRRVDITALQVGVDNESRATRVTMDVIQRPYKMDGPDDIKRWRWTLSPCRVRGELPAVLFQVPNG